MPGRKFHNRINELIFNKSFDNVNAAKDSASPYLGKGHRIVGHDKTSNILIGLADGDPRAIIAAMIHDDIDRAVSKLPESLRRIFYD